MSATLPNGERGRWEGRMEATVEAHAGQIAAFNGDVRAIRNAIGKIHARLAAIESGLNELGRSMADTIEAREKEREDELTQTREAVKQAVATALTSKQDLYRYVVAPVVVGALLLVLAMALTGKAGLF